MKELEIQLADQDSSCEPGATLRVPISWSFDEEQTGLELRVVWNTAGKGTQDLDVAHTESIEHPGIQGSRVVTLELPRAPYSFSGTLISVVWAMELVAFPSRASTRQEIVIAPQGHEVIMTSVDDGDQEGW